MAQEFIFKIVLIGDKMVGKTSLINRYVHDRFQGRYMGTIGLNVSTKDLSIEHNGVMYDIHLLIYDLASEETFEDLFGPFSKGASGAIFVFDITRKNTLESIDDWMTRLNKLTSTELNSTSILIGNKSDLTEFREVNNSEGKQKAQDLNMIDFEEASAKNNSFVEPAFTLITQKILKENIKD